MTDLPAPPERPPQMSDLLSAIYRDDLEDVKGILDKGVSANATNEKNSNVLLLILKKNKNGQPAGDTNPQHLEIIRLLIERGADVKAVNDLQETPLHWAAEHGYLETARLLLESGADINATNSEGETPLIIATHRQHGPVVELLLKQGAAQTAVDNRLKTAEDWAHEAHDKSISAIFQRLVHDATAEKQQLLRKAAPRIRLKTDPSP